MNQVFQAALVILTRRACTEQELRRKLEKKFADQSDQQTAIDSAIQRLQELQLLNDTSVAESLARRGSHRGNRYIAQSLRQKGVNDEDIALALSGLDDEYSRALKEARKKAALQRRDDSEKAKARVYRFLCSRGFKYDLISAVLRQMHEEGLF